MNDGFGTHSVKSSVALRRVVLTTRGADPSGPGRSRGGHVNGGVFAMGEALGASAAPVAAGGVHARGATA